MGFQDIVARIDFNWDNDKKEFGGNTRIVSLNSFIEDGDIKVSLSLGLGRKEDDTFNLTFDVMGFTQKLIATLISRED